MFRTRAGLTSVGLAPTPAAVDRVSHPVRVQAAASAEELEVLAAACLWWDPRPLRRSRG